MANVQIERRAAAALLALGLGLGLWGIRWGLPSRERAARVLPPGLASDSAFQRELADNWSKLHEDLGANLMVNPKSFGTFAGVVDVPAGWTVPPKELLNSARSFLVRSGHEDEQSILLALSRMRPHRLQLRPHLFTYGALHIYSVGAALAAGAAVGLVPLKGSILFYLEDPARMASLYMAGRLLTVAAYVLGALLLLRLGRKVGTEAGVLGAAIYLMTPAAVVQAHVLKNHTFWTVFALWTLWRSMLVLETGRRRDYAAAGAAAGLATASFLGAWPACLVVAAAGALRLLGLHAPQGRPCRPAPELVGLAVAGAWAAGAFLVVSPYWVLDYPEAMAEMKVLSGFGGLHPSHVGVFLANALRRGVTEPVLILMLGGAAFALARGRREPALLLCALAFLIGLFAMATVGGVVSTRQVRYFTGWVAVGGLLAGRLLAEFRAMKGAAGRFGTAAAAVILLGLLAQGLAYAGNFAAGAGERSTHLQAGAWIDANVPAGETLGLLRYPQPSNSPYFRWNRLALRFLDPKAVAAIPEKAWPKWLALTIPDYDDRPLLGDALSRYELAASFPRACFIPWIEIDPTSTTANPQIEIYRKRAMR
ncbi:MAG: glycosyltransferase family 39 protein [Elusimicrobiota bacterium]|nr:MAG: glycosyltransferase family 39 protein [Elusimicrobiota bacterium]